MNKNEANSIKQENDNKKTEKTLVKCCFKFNPHQYSEDKNSIVMDNEISITLCRLIENSLTTNFNSNSEQKKVCNRAVKLSKKIQYDSHKEGNSIIITIYEQKDKQKDKQDIKCILPLLIFFEVIEKYKKRNGGIENFLKKEVPGSINYIKHLIKLRENIPGIIVEVLFFDSETNVSTTVILDNITFNFMKEVNELYRSNVVVKSIKYAGEIIAIKHQKASKNELLDRVTIEMNDGKNYNRQVYFEVERNTPWYNKVHKILEATDKYGLYLLGDLYKPNGTWYIIPSEIHIFEYRHKEECLNNLIY